MKRSIKKSFAVMLAILFYFLSYSQNRTVGTILYEDGVLEGYTFFSPFSGHSAYMIDNCGNLINTWEQGTLPGLAAYFQSSGEMLRTYKVSPEGPFTSASNAGGLALVDWENNTTWSYELNTETELSHHDAVQMPNGNFLMLTWEVIFEEELISLGRDPNEIAPQGIVWGERIIEAKPIGNDDIEIVWEWRIKDHFIQDRDSTLLNYGIISEHPELFDINLPDINSSNSHSDFDYNHFNAIDYHEELDQILISVRNSDEIWILDHSTSTEEAASHEGGNSGMGGDILYRWGNPSAYQGASISKQRLFGQHGVNWIKEGPSKDKILIYNNGNGRPGTDFSTVEILSTPILENDTYQKNEGEPFGPEAVDWVYGDELDQRFYSPFLSNAQYLENGNILINAGSPGEIREINSEKEVVWNYVVPLFGDFPATQGGNINNNGIFRGYKYPLDYEGFNGVTIIVGEPIEVDPIPLEICENLNSLESEKEYLGLEVYANGETIYIENPAGKQFEALVYTSNGILADEFTFQGDYYVHHNSKLNSGIYFIRFISNGKSYQAVPVLIRVK